MRNILRNKPIFYTLLGVGVFELIMAFLLGKNFVRSLLQLVIPIIIGIVLGIMVALSEIYLYQKKSTSRYNPTQIPYMVVSVILLLNIVTPSFRLYIMIVFGAYLITLAFLFRKYEISTHQKGITWNEVLPK